MTSHREIGLRQIFSFGYTVLGIEILKLLHFEGKCTSATEEDAGM